MDQYVTKSLKRLLYNTKEWNENKFNSVSYSANTNEATINMTKIKSIMKLEASPPKKNVNFSTSIETIDTETNKFINTNLDSDIQTVNLSNKIKLVKVKVMQSPLKKVPAMYNLCDYANNSNDSVVPNIAHEPIYVEANIHKNSFESEESNESNTEFGDYCRPLSPMSPERVPMWKTMPKLGTKAYLSRGDSKTDSEIISDLVNSRFVVNLYESRLKEPSCNQGKIYKSLDRSCNLKQKDFLNNHVANFCQSTLKAVPTKIRTSPLGTLPKSNHNTSILPNIYEDMNNLSISNISGSSEEETNQRPTTSGYVSASSSSEKAKKNNSPVSSLSSYNVEEFLKVALGDEIKTPEPEYNEIGSLDTSNASLLISKLHTIRSNLFRTVTRNFQHVSETFRGAEHQTKTEDKPDLKDLTDLFSNNEPVTSLLKKAAVQYETLKQITKALTVCDNTKEFCESLEQVEGERLLLVVTHKRQAILDEIHQLTYTSEANCQPKETGTVAISGIWLPLKSLECDSPRVRDLTRWYVVIFSCGSQVYATQIATASGDDAVKFSEEVIFEELPTDFDIKVEVFCLLQKRSGRNYSHESKFHINKISKHSRCPKPRRLLKKKNCQILPGFNLDIIRTSSFKYCGSFNLTVSDLPNTEPHHLRGQIPFCSLLTSQVNFTLESSIRIPVKLSGFITVGCDIGGCTAWTRRWCILQDNCIKIWSSPDEEETTPRKEINLRYCANAKIQIVERALCAKPRTLLLEIKKLSQSDLSVDSTFILERYYLSLDNVQELHNWQKELDNIVQILRVWHSGIF